MTSPTAIELIQEMGTPSFSISCDHKDEDGNLCDRTVGPYYWEKEALFMMDFHKKAQHFRQPTWQDSGVRVKRWRAQINASKGSAK